MANPNHINVIEVDPHGIALLKARRSAKGLHVDAYIVDRGDWSGEGELVDALKAFAKKYDLGKAPVYSVLPRHEMTARVLTLPSQDMAEIIPMVRNTAEDYVPYPEHELVIDAAIVEKLDDGQSRVFAAFAQNHFVDGQVALLKSAGIEPARLFVSTACVASAAMAIAPGPGDRVAVVWLGLGGLEVLVFNGRHLEYARAIAGVHDWSRAAEPASDELEELGMEVRSSLAAHKRESEEGLGADSIVVCSAWADPAPIADALTHVVGYECKAGTLSSAFNVKSTETSCEPAAAFGAALAAQDRAACVIDLVPQSLMRSRAAGQLKKKALQGVLLAAAVVAGMFGLYFTLTYQRQAYINQLDERIEQIREPAESVAVKRSQLARIQRSVDATGSALELLGEFSALAPGAELNITRFNYTQGKELVIGGRTMDFAYFDRLVEELRATGREDEPLFSKATQGPFKQVTENGQPVYEYEILIPFPEGETVDDEDNYNDFTDDGDV